MVAVLGHVTLALAFLLALYGLVAAGVGLVKQSGQWIESARLALILIFVFLTISTGVLLLLLATKRFDVVFVHSVINRGMPLYLRLTALWGGQSGSLLFWSWLLAGFSIFFALRKWHDAPELLPWGLMVVFFVLGFFLILNVFFETPFNRFWLFPDGSQAISVIQPPGSRAILPLDGQGLNPLLRHPGMIWHPPTLYLGFVGFIIPFALAVGTLASGRRDHRWLVIARPWVLIAWIFLTLGLVLGMRWAYDILGWGGYWGWDPVEIAALMPWLSATAFLHTALLQKYFKRYQRWNLSLIILTFVLIIFGTFITRSGLLSSVHAFADSDIGLPMFIFLTLLSLGSLGVIIYRWRDFETGHEPEFGFSKEVLTLFTNLVLLSILAVCFLGVIYPVISELLTDTQITVGPAWYQRILGPLLILQLLLVGLCPLAAWSGTSLIRIKQQLKTRQGLLLVFFFLLLPFALWFIVGLGILAQRGGFLTLFSLWLVGFSILSISWDYIQKVIKAYQQKTDSILSALWAPIRRNHRRYGGVLVHLGFVIMSIGIIGIEGLQQETQVTLSLGESVEIRGYVLRFEGLEHSDAGSGIMITESVLSLTRDGKPIGALYPQRDIYLNMGMAITQPGLRSNLAGDLYAVLIDWRPLTQDEATFRVFYNPLVAWLWIGTGVLTLGALLAVLPDKAPFRSAIHPKIDPGQNETG